MSIRILEPGFLTTIQDEGRMAYEDLGVSISGAMDRRALYIGNMLVNNPPGEGALEITVIGPRIEFTEDNIIAITGGDFTPVINDFSVDMYKAIRVKKGDILSFKGIKSGCRAYMALAGGFNVPEIMKSKSTNINAKLGGYKGRKLQKGDEILCQSPKCNLHNLENRSLLREEFHNNHIVLRVLMGPQDDYFTSKGIETFLKETYAITNDFDRMGYRLQGPGIEHINGGDIITDGIAFGAIQVPSKGQPIIMVADRQTTGGYAKIANVISVDLPKLAQTKWGDKISFKKVTIEEAQRLYLKELEELESMKEYLNTNNSNSKTIENHGERKNIHSSKEVKLYRIVVNGIEYMVKCEEV